MSDIADKKGEQIEVGDHVYTKFRGGRHEGEAEKIVHDESEAKDFKGIQVKNPPKVLFHDQNDKLVSHNPETLEKVS